MFLSSVKSDFYYMCELWNLLNSRIFGILALGLPVQVNWASKKPSWEIRVLCKCSCGEWAAVRG